MAINKDPSSGSSGKADRLLVDYVIPTFIVATILATLTLSNVPPNLWILKGYGAEALLISYMALVIFSVAKPDIPKIHEVGAILGLFTFIGRGGGFLELVVGQDRPDLLAAVIERLLLSAFILRWHMFQAWSAGVRTAAELTQKG